MIILATDIGGTKLVAALTGIDGQIHDHHEFPTLANQAPEILCDALSALVSPLQAHAQRVIIASTRIIRDGSLLAPNSYNLGGLLHFPLVKTLEQPTNLPTIAINDAQAVAWTEFQASDGDITGMVFITVSTGAGGGVVNGCKLLTGPGGLVGHIGYTPAGPYGPVCGCGRTDYMETIASGRGIAVAAQGGLADADVRTIPTHVGQGDEQVQQLIHRPIRTLARLIVDIKVTTDYQCAVVGGSVGLAEGYLALVETYLAQESAAFHVGLLVAHYRHDASLLGVALLAQGERS